MNKHLNFEINCDTFSANRVDSFGVLRFKKNFLLRTTDLTDRDKILDYLDLLSKNDLIKAVVVIGAPDSKGREEYKEFFHQALKLGKDSNLRKPRWRRQTDLAGNLPFHYGGSKNS